MNSTNTVVSLANSDLFPRMAIEDELDAYNIMHTSALSQLVLFTDTPDLLSVLKELIEHIRYDVERNAKHKTSEDHQVYFELINLIDELDVLHYIGDTPRVRKRNRRLKSVLSEWSVPRHLVIIAIEKIAKLKEYQRIFSDTSPIKKATNKQLRQYVHQRNRLANSNLRLVMSIAKRFRYLGLPFDDLVQEGCIGLIKAIERFNPSKGYLFSTYAHLSISQTIHFAIEQHSSTVRKPNTLMRDKALVDKTRATLEQRLSRPPRSSDFEQHLSNTAASKSAYIALNIQPTADCDNYRTPLNTPEIYPQMEASEQDFKTHFLNYRDWLETALSKLDTRSHQVIRMRFGIGIKRTYSLKEIGETLSISTERSRQISVSAIDTLKIMYQRENKPIKYHHAPTKILREPEKT